LSKSNALLIDQANNQQAGASVPFKTSATPPPRLQYISEYSQVFAKRFFRASKDTCRKIITEKFKAEKKSSRICYIYFTYISPK